MKVGGRTEGYVVHCKRNERRALAWFRTETWKLRGLKDGIQRGTRLLGRDGKNDNCILLNCQEAQRWRNIRERTGYT